MINSDDNELVKALFREDYYTILKNRKHPEDRLEHKWAALRTKFTILNQHGKL